MNTITRFRKKTAYALVLLLSSGCADNNPPPVQNDLTITSPAANLGIYSTDLPEDSKRAARLALEQDAFRRESRFVNAIEPGFLAQSTRVNQDEIDQNLWSKEDLFAIGAQLFNLSFTKDIGFGAAQNQSVTRIQNRNGGPDAFRCATCHWRGGPAGSGDTADNAYFEGDKNTQQSALERNPPSLIGAGVVELIAKEITSDLKQRRDIFLNEATSKHKPVTGLMSSHGVNYGSIVISAEGAIDTSSLQGIDGDLVIKPFGRKGHFASIREMVELSLALHHGMQTSRAASWPNLTDSSNTSETPSSSQITPSDGDRDGIVEEITEGQLTALSSYIAMQEMPTEVVPNNNEFVLLMGQGRALFDSCGCATCHTPTVTLATTVYQLPSRVSSSILEIDLAKESAAPRLRTEIGSTEITVNLYSDLKRHKMGDSLAESRPQRGVPKDEFITPPLWGVARSRPYLHDGRAPNLQEAIFWHGGEASTARDRYQALPESERAALRVFLTSLTRAPRLVTQ